MVKQDLCMDLVFGDHAIKIGYQMKIHCPAALVTVQMTSHLFEEKRNFTTFHSYVETKINLPG